MENLTRRFYVKYNDAYLCLDTIGVDEVMVWVPKEYASTLTDGQYDLIKHLIHNDHTLELV